MKKTWEIEDKVAQEFERICKDKGFVQNHHMTQMIAEWNTNQRGEEQ